MARITVRLSQTFTEFFRTEKAGAVVLILCTFISLAVANTAIGSSYIGFFHSYLGPLSVEHWINDGLMAIFFLLIGLELKRELMIGELSNFKTASLPIIAALGGVVLPALIHFSLNAGTPTQRGMGIPMATDIAFAIGILSLVGDRVPASLKVFLVALAVMDDLAAIVVIAIFYTADLALFYLVGALALLGGLYLMGKMGVRSLVPFLLIGIIAWAAMLKSGVHATIAGVLLAFVIPFKDRKGEIEHSPSSMLEHALHHPVAFVILPIFALANTAIVIAPGVADGLMSPNSLGIMLGLFLGKPIGITLASVIAVTTGISRLPLDIGWKHVFGAGILAGVGFTMAIFIANLAFERDLEQIDLSKMAILTASVTSAISGLIFLKLFGAPLEGDDDPETMDLAPEDA
jgi:Na+:H+ antiporter, NhaA family